MNFMNVIEPFVPLIDILFFFNFRVKHKNVKSIAMMTSIKLNNERNHLWRPFSNLNSDTY